MASRLVFPPRSSAAAWLLRCLALMLDGPLLGSLVLGSLVLGGLVLGFAGQAIGQEVAGSGSTFAFPVMAKWAEAFAMTGGGRVAYQPIGSARGIGEISAGLVDFGITDAPLADAQLLRDGLLQFPLVIGAILPVVNLDGVPPGALHVSGAVLADIYLGKIRNWHDPAIVALNPDVALPNRPILVVYRSDGSGTTYNWADFLAKSSAVWRAQVGVGTTVAWPTGVGGQGNGGVAEKVARAKGAIGYVEYAYATRHGLSYALIENRAGAFVMPSPESFLAATDGVDWNAGGDFDVMLTDSPRPDAYPLMATSFVLIRKYPGDKARSRTMMAFFQWALEHGQGQATSLGYLPLPGPLVATIERYWGLQLQAMASRAGG